MDVKDSLTKSYLAGAYEFRSQEDKVRQLSAIYHSPRRVAQLPIYLLLGSAVYTLVKFEL